MVQQYHPILLRFATLRWFQRERRFFHDDRLHAPHGADARLLSKTQYDTFCFGRKAVQAVCGLILIGLGISGGNAVPSVLCLFAGCWLCMNTDTPAKVRAGKVISSMNGRFPFTRYRFSPTEILLDAGEDGDREPQRIAYSSLIRLVEDEGYLELDSEIIQKFIDGDTSQKKKTKKLEIDLRALILKHPNDPRFVKLGERLEKLRREHEAGLMNSIEFLKALLALAKEAAQMEQEVVPEEEQDKGKAMLTRLFERVRNSNTPVIVERIVADIDGIVRKVRFPG